MPDALESTFRPRRLSEVASRYGLTLVGEDREVVTAGPIDSRSAHRDRLLTFVTAAAWLERFATGDVAAAIVPEALAAAGAPDGRTLLTTTGDAEAAFYGLLADSADAGEWTTLTSARGDGTVVHPHATVEDGVQLGAGCTVMAGAVLLANTRLGDRVVVKPNATLGGEGFQIREIHGRRRIVPHTGGVDVRDDAAIGSSTCVDRGLFGDFTTVHAGAHVDNLVHVAHNVVIGPQAAVVACAEVSGSVTLGEGAWIGPNAAINPSLQLGDWSYVGTGATVVRDVPAHALVYGSPAKLGGWMCRCRTKLTIADGEAAACPRCGRRYRLDGLVLRELT